MSASLSATQRHCVSGQACSHLTRFAQCRHPAITFLFFDRECRPLGTRQRSTADFGARVQAIAATVPNGVPSGVKACNGCKSAPFRESPSNGPAPRTGCSGRVRSISVVSWAKITIGCAAIRRRVALAWAARCCQTWPSRYRTIDTPRSSRRCHHRPPECWLSAARRVVIAPAAAVH